MDENTESAQGMYFSGMKEVDNEGEGKEEGSAMSFSREDVVEVTAI